MERKIGEIFEFGGEWYQCVVAIQGCRECSFRTQDYCTRRAECTSTERSDKTSVIFKKLEKAGEPIEFARGLYFQRYQLADKAGRAWVADFGNAVYALVEDSLDALQTAIANALGRYQGVQERNVCAGIIVAQSLASEATAYVERRARMFTRFTLVAHDGVRRSVSSVLRTMSCKGISHNLEVVARALLERRLPDGTDLLADPSVATGVKAVMNRLCEVDTWTAARDKADELNDIKNKI